MKSERDHAYPQPLSRPCRHLVEVRGFEPLAPTLRTYPTLYGSHWCVRIS